MRYSSSEAPNQDIKALSFGIQAGYDRQFSNRIVAGIAADIARSEISGSQVTFANEGSTALNNANLFYDRAFQHKGADGKPTKGDNYDETLKIIADYLEEPPAQVEAGLPYFNPDARLVSANIAEQIEIWQSAKQLDGSLSVEKVVDASFLPKAKAGM